MKKIVVGRVVVILLALGVVSLTALAEEPTTAPAQAPIPNDASIKDAQKLVNEVYADDMAKAKKPDEKLALAKKLLQSAIETKDDIAGKYVLLNMAKDLAAGAGNAETAFAAIAELEQYKIDSLSMKLKALSIFSKLVSDQDAGALFDRINPLIDEAIDSDRYDVAGQLAQLGVSLAKATKDLTAIKGSAGWVREVKAVDAAHTQVKGALATLADKPKDPEANLAVGRFYCFTKVSWEKGLPMLALGSDSELKKLADMELANPTEAKKQMEIADGWWDVAGKETGTIQRHIRRYADEWYEKALPSLTGLSEAKVKKRLADLKTLLG